MKNKLVKCATCGKKISADPDNTIGYNVLDTPNNKYYCSLRCFQLELKKTDPKQRVLTKFQEAELEKNHVRIMVESDRQRKIREITGVVAREKPLTKKQEERLDAAHDKMLFELNKHRGNRESKKIIDAYYKVWAEVFSKKVIGMANKTNAKKPVRMSKARKKLLQELEKIFYTQKSIPFEEIWKDFKKSKNKE